METKINPKKLLVITAAVALMGLGLMLLILELRTATIAINAPSEATLYAKQGEDDWRELGTSPVQFKTRSLETVFIEARNGEQVSQQSTNPERHKTKSLDLTLKHTAQIARIAEGPLTYPLIEGGLVYGINPTTRSLTIKPAVGSTAPLPRPPTLPFLRQVLWLDSQNFVYVSQGRGSGRVTNGQINESQRVTFAAAQTIDSQSFGLLSAEGFHLTRTRDLADNSLVSTNLIGSTPSLLADHKNYYFINLVYKAGVSEDSQRQGDKTRIMVFDQTGIKRWELELPLTEPTLRIVELPDSRLGVLTTSALWFVDPNTKAVEQQQFSFGQTDDLLVFNQRLLLLSQAGLWEYDQALGQFSRLAKFPEGEIYTPESFSQLDEHLYFSTTISDQAILDSNSGAGNGFYQVKF